MQISSGASSAWPLVGLIALAACWTFFLRRPSRPAGAETSLLERHFLQAWQNQLRRQTGDWTWCRSLAEDAETWNLTSNECPRDVVLEKELLEYIHQLRVQDPRFYDIFTAEEIYAYFKPEERSKIPWKIYLWDTHPVTQEFLRECTEPKDPNFFPGSHLTFYWDLKNSSQVAPDPDSATVHFIPLADPSFVECEKFDVNRFNEPAKEILESAAWKRFNGANFFKVGPHYMDEVVTSKRELEVMEWVTGKKKVKPADLTPREVLFLTAPSLYQAANPHLRVCTADAPFTPGSGLRLAKHWPEGQLESYTYPGGMYTQMKRKRPYNLIFMGRADERPRYGSRVKALQTLKDVMKPSILLRYVQSDPPLRNCTEPTDYNACNMPQKWLTKNTFSELLMKSKFALHMPGDELSSARFSDIATAQALPVVTFATALDISTTGQCHIPWRDIAIFIDQAEWDADPKKAIEKYVEPLTHFQLEKRLRLLYYYRDSFLNGFPVHYPPNRLVAAEKKVDTFIHTCLPQQAFAEQLSKRKYALCPFEDFRKVQGWTPIPDEDDVPAYSPSWYQALTAAN